jgi:hypothetical protein
MLLSGEQSGRGFGVQAHQVIVLQWRARAVVEIYDKVSILRIHAIVNNPWLSSECFGSSSILRAEPTAARVHPDWTRWQGALRDRGANQYEAFQSEAFQYEAFPVLAAVQGNGRLHMQRHPVQLSP